MNNDNRPHKSAHEKIPTVKELLQAQTSESRRLLVSNWVMIGATIFLAIAAGYDAITNKDDVTSRRPYISIENPTITKKDDRTHKFVAEIRNIGGRATSPGATVSIYPIQREIKENKTTYIKAPPNHVLIPNELIPASPVITYNYDFLVEGVPNYFIVKLKYRDGVVNDEYQQILFFNWIVGEPLTLVKEETAWRELTEYFIEND